MIIQDSFTARESIQLAICCLHGVCDCSDPDIIAERHPAVAGALRALIPHATIKTLVAIKAKIHLDSPKQASAQ